MITLITGEGSKTMAVLKGIFLGLIVVIMSFGGIITALILFR